MIHLVACASSLARATDRSCDWKEGGQAFALHEVTNESDSHVEQHLLLCFR